jgi:hypothetical protein
MCDSREAIPHSPRPGWSRLLAVLPVTAAALGLIESTAAALPLTIAAEAGIVLAAFGAMALWVRANGSALDQLDVCACASEMPTIRVVRSLPEHPSRRGAPVSRPAIAPVSAFRGHWTGAKLRA